MNFSRNGREARRKQPAPGHSMVRTEGAVQKELSRAGSRLPGSLPANLWQHRDLDGVTHLAAEHPAVRTHFLLSRQGCSATAPITPPPLKLAYTALRTCTAGSMSNAHPWLHCVNIVATQSALLP